MSRHLMTLNLRAWSSTSGVTALALAVLSCGGGPKAPSTPTATPTPVAQATPTPTPTPAPSPSPTVDPLGLASGPVASVKAYLKTVETTRGSQVYRDPQKDANGIFTLYVGEFVVVDSTQRNSAGQICRWIRPPAYSWNNDDDMMNIKSSSEPFFFKFEVAGPGYAEVSSKIDGMESNDVTMRAVVKR